MSKVLIVVDMQEDFVNGSIGTKQAQEIVPSVISKIKGFEGMVIYTRDTHEANYLETEEGKNLPIEHCIKGTFGWYILPEVLAAGYAKRPIKYLKPWYNKSTFGCEQLASDLKNLYVNEAKDLEIEIIGLCTEICVVTNALLLKTYMPEIKISVDANCCAGVTQETHEAALKTMQMCQIRINGM